VTREQRDQIEIIAREGDLRVFLLAAMPATSLAERMQKASDIAEEIRRCALEIQRLVAESSL
jgi:inosine-uridine nucleoside N-ribohydrolase